MTREEARDLVFDRARKWGKVLAQLRREETKTERHRTDTQAKIDKMRDYEQRYYKELEIALDALESVAYREGEEDGFDEGLCK